MLLYFGATLWTLLSAVCFVIANHTSNHIWGALAFIFLAIAFMHWTFVFANWMGTSSKFEDVDKKFRNY
jgi:hypothetical protein